MSEACRRDGEEEVADDEEDGEGRNEEAGPEDTQGGREEDDGPGGVDRCEGDRSPARLGTGALLGTLIRDERAHEARDLGRVLLVEEELRVR